MLKEIFLKKFNTQSKTVHNAIIKFGDIDDSGKGRKFESRFIQPGIAGYPGQFGNVLITKETLDKFIQTMVGKPLIINHKEIITQDDIVGEVLCVWFNPKDGWFWCSGVSDDETAINLVTDKGWSVSCSYDVKLADDAGGTENNIKYDMEFLDGVFTHLAIVENPRYERANIVFNSKTVIQNAKEEDKLSLDNKIYNDICNLVENYIANPLNITKKDIPLLKEITLFLENSVNNGRVTLKGKVDEDGKPIRVYIPNYVPSGGEATNFHLKIANENKENNIVYEFVHTRANITEQQKNFIKNSVDEIVSNFRVEPPIKGLNVCTIGGGCLGVAISSPKTRTLSLDSAVFKEKGEKAFNDSVKDGWLARTDKDVLTSVLTHELGHIITAGTEKKEFWDKINKIKSEYVENIKVDDIKNKDYISKYARKNKDEFVAESFAQATLLKTPSKYAKMVLEEINKHFKLSEKENKQLRLFNAVMEALNMSDNIINNEKEEEIEITWVESDGVGYCLTEEDYNNRKKEVEEHTKQETNK